MSTAREGASSPSSPLERGKACLRCRRRKMRCDGARPKCAQCVRADEIECEYTDGGPTASQLLEQNVAQLEARIRELEGRSSESITLHDPHAAFSQSRNRPAVHYAVTGGERGEATPDQWHIPEAILNSFVGHAFAFGFFLNTPRFMARLTGGANTLPAVILYAIHMVGLVTLQDPQLKSQETQIVSLLTESLSSAVSNLDPSQILYILQAEILLSNYFFHQDRRLEGGYHVTAAVSIVLSSNLHQLSDRRRGTASSSHGPDVYWLPPPADNIEQGERINAFWAVLSLDRCWSVALGSQSALARVDLMASQISTPWPLDMADYEMGMYPEVLIGQTVPSFLEQHTVDISADSYTAKHAKAVVLFSIAVELGSHFAPEDLIYKAKFLELDNQLQSFKQSIQSVVDGFRAAQQPGGSQYSTPPGLYGIRARCLLYTQTLALCASIKLHTPLQQDWDINTSRTLSNAVQAADLLKELDISAMVYIDPFMGILWSTVAEVLIRALTIARTLRTANAPSVLSGTPFSSMSRQGSAGLSIMSDQEAVVAVALDRIFNVMESLTAVNPSALLIDRELRNIRQHHVMSNSL